MEGKFWERSLKTQKHKEYEKLRKRSTKKTKQTNAKMTSSQPNIERSSGLIYNCRKAQTKKLKLSEGFQQNTN